MKKILTFKQKRAQEILKSKTSVVTQNIHFIYMPKSELIPTNTIIISVSKKTAVKSTQRNRLKRQLRGIMRDIRFKNLFDQYDWMIICKTSIITKDQRTSIIETLQQKLS